jgi:hypothetical protein
VGLGENDVSCQLFDRSIRLGHVVDFLTVAHDHEPVAHLIGVIEVMGHEYAGHVLGAQLLDLVENRLGLAHRKGASGLVQQQDTPLEIDGAGDGDRLLLAA